MKLNYFDKVIINQFKRLGDIEHPGCTTTEQNLNVYREIQDHMFAVAQRQTSLVAIDIRWMELKRWWKNHQEIHFHASYRGDRCLHECPTKSERCIHMAFIAVCDRYRDLYKKKQAVMECPAEKLSTIILD